MDITQTPVLYNQLIRLSRQLEAKLMAELIAEGFQGLSMSFADPMMVITLGPIRMNQLAEELGISKQLCNQTLKPLEQLDIIQRNSDPEDKRAKLVSLTERGIELATAAQNIIQTIQLEIIEEIGQEALDDMHEQLWRIAQGAQLKANPLVPTTGLISLVSRYCERQLMQLTIKQGFDFLQMSYSQVLNYLVPGQKNHDTKTLTELAELNHVSLQAISRIVRELEQHKIIRKSSAKRDKRIKVISLTKKGERLFHCSINSVNQLNQHCLEWVSNDELNQLSQALCTLNQSSEKLLSNKEIQSERQQQQLQQICQRLQDLGQQDNNSLNQKASQYLKPSEQTHLFNLLHKIKI